MYSLILVLCGTLLLSLAALNRSIAGLWTYPPALFSGLWAAAFFGLWAVGDLYYAITLPVMLVFVLGAICFSAGGLVTLGTAQYLSPPRPTSRVADSPSMGRILDWSIVLLLLSIPFFYRRLTELAAAVGISDFWVALRTEIAYGAGGQSAALGGFSRILAVATFLCFIATAELNQTFASKRRAAILISVTVTMNAITMARLGAAVTIFGCVGIFIFNSQRLSLRSMLLVGVSLISVFAPAAILLGKGGSKDAGIAENISGVSESIALYAVGNLVALDQAVLNNQRSTPQIPDFIRVPARALGLIEQPLALEQYDPYVNIPAATNNYTIYYQYFTSYGFIGVILTMTAIGAGCTAVYAAAFHGSQPAIAILGTVFGNLVVSLANDGFFRGLSYNLQAIFLIVVLYKVAAFLDRWSLHRSEFAAEGVAAVS